MTKIRYNLTTPIKMQDGGTFWHSVGAAWYDSEKNQLSMEFNSLPLPNEEGKVRVLGFPPKDGQAAAATGRTWPQKKEEFGRDSKTAPKTAAKRGKTLKEDLDDEIPF